MTKEFSLDNMEAKEAGNLIIPLEVFAGLIGVVLCYQIQGTSIPLELLFPLHILYHVWTHNKRHAGANLLPGRLIPWIYVFGEVWLVRQLGNVGLPCSWFWLQAMYLGLVLLPIGNPIEYTELRGIAFIGEGIYKSSLLVNSMLSVFITAKGFGGEGVLSAVVLGAVVLLTVPVIDALEQVVRSGRVDTERLGQYLRITPVIITLLIGLMYWEWPTDLVLTQERQFTFTQMLTCLLFVLWYGHHSIDYLQWESQHKRL